MWKYDVEVAHVPERKLRQTLVSGKDKSSKEAFPGVVYKIPCADCNCVFIRETNNFKHRLCHENDVDKKAASSNVLAGHKAKSSHAKDWMNMSTYN